VCTADKGRLGQVIGNLITNSIKYSPEGTRIRLLVRKLNNGVRFYVRDEGPGIAEDQIADLFELFVRANRADSRKVSGSGIGLYVSRKIVESHGGEIAITSKEGKYTTVCFWIPDAPAAQDAKAAAEAA
jgi:two-component system sensor histidine kinase VicK